MTEKNIILASESQYKKALLERLQLSFITHAPYIDEQILTNETAETMVIRLAKDKAYAIKDHYSNGIIISTDQCAVSKKEILGKPRSKEKAIQQLKKLSNQEIIFYTGLAVLEVAKDILQTAIVPFKVSFRSLTEAEIIRYLDKEPAFDAAGSFKSESLGISLCKQLQGDDPTALVGLPLIELSNMLRKLDISVP